MLKRIFLIVLVALFLTACSDEKSEPAPSKQNNKIAAADNELTPEKAIKMSISGDETFEFNYNGAFGCNGDVMSVSMMAHSPTMQLSMPSSLKEGEHTVYSWDANSTVIARPTVKITGEVTDARIAAGSTRGNLYSKVEQGSITIKQIPRASGEKFIATANLAMKDYKNEARITARLDFNIASIYGLCK